MNWEVLKTEKTFSYPSKKFLLPVCLCYLLFADTIGLVGSPKDSSPAIFFTINIKGEAEKDFVSPEFYNGC